MLTINKMVKVSHQIAKNKGWWDKKSFNFGEKLALIHSEISECLEEHRVRKPALYYRCTRGGISLLPGHDIDPKPEGALIELADAVIRIGDLCGKMGWDLEKAIMLKTRYNLTRPHRHGGKRC